jgi:hypothetical protein
MTSKGRKGSSRDSLTPSWLLTAQGLPKARAEYFLDPWNSPYWIRAQCSKDRSRVSVYVYSFGPNRRRDSDLWQIVDDDVGAYVIQIP